MNLTLAGRKQRYLQLGLVGLMLLALLLYTMAAIPAHAATDGISPASGTLGTSFTFKASGFTPGEKVDLWTTNPSAAAATANYMYADTSGNITVQINSADPDGLAVAAAANYTQLMTDYNSDGTVADFWLSLTLYKPVAGNWALSAQGETSSVAKSFGFTITPGAQISNTSSTSTTVSVSPASGVLGSIFTLKASGFEPGEKVSFWTTDPSGSALDASYMYADTSGNIIVKVYSTDPNGLATALGTNYTSLQTDYDSDGNVVDNWLQLIPLKPAAGNWHLSAAGDTSGNSAVFSFTTTAS